MGKNSETNMEQAPKAALDSLGSPSNRGHSRWYHGLVSDVHIRPKHRSCPRTYGFSIPDLSTNCGSISLHRFLGSMAVSQAQTLVETADAKRNGVVNK